MIKFFRNILFVIGLLCEAHLQAQHLSFSENEQAHRRYWYYRTRFINDFIKIGGAQGDGICFPERNDANYGGTVSTKAKVGPDQIDITNQYLSALALEYKLLSRNNQSTTETIKEIFYLLKTINRLDARAEEFWGGNPPSTDNMSSYSESANLNGFMLREDMPRNYLDPAKNYTHYNYAITEITNPPGNTNLGYAGLRKIDGLTKDNKFSNYKGFGSGSDYTQQKEDLSCPHDKYQSMFIAFMFLVKYIPASTGYYENGVLQTFQDGESGIIEEVKKITNRCLPYIRGDRFGSSHNTWFLDYPNGSNLVVGQNAFSYAYPFATMVCHINGGYPYSVPCNSYQDVTSLYAGAQSYGILPYNPIPPTTPTIGSEDAGVFINNCMAGSNSAVHPFGSPIGIPAYDAIHYSATINHVQWAELVRKVLHQKGLMRTSPADYSGPIASAPCMGPYNFGGGNDAGSDWKSPDRLEHPKYLGSASPEGGNYPGVDYMFLHNLYYEYLNQQNDAEGYRAAYNLMDNYDSGIWPRQINVNVPGNGISQSLLIGVDANVSQITNPPGPGTLLTSKQPAYIKVFQTLESTAKIYATSSPLAPNNTIPSKVEYRAGKLVHFKDGFYVQLGANFHSYNKRYVCADGDYGSGMRQAQNADGSDNDYMSDYMNTIVPIHYVEGPKSASDGYPNDFGEDAYSNEEINQYAMEDYTVIAPNPSSGLVRIQTRKVTNEEILSVNVYDMKGILVLSLNDINTEQEINLESYSKGIYIIKISSTTGRNTTKKVSIVD